MREEGPVPGTAQRTSDRRWIPLLLVAVMVLLTLGGPLLGRSVLHASDVLQVYSPWKADAPPGFVPRNTMTSDTVDATVPVRIEWRRRALAGDLPLWTDLQAGGAPLASIPNASAFSPLSLPWYLVPAWYAPAASKLLEVLVAAGFTFLFLRRLGAGRAAGGVAAVAFAGSGFQVVWTNWPQSHVGALVPGLFWAVERLIERGRPRDAVPVALVSASMWLEGFPAVTLWAHLAVGVYALVRVLARDGAPPRVVDRVRRLGLPLVGVGLGVAVAAFQLIPFAHRLGQLDLAYREEKTAYGALPWRTLVTTIVPDAFGNPVDRVYYGQLNYVEIQSFLGAAVVVLAITGVVLGRRTAVRRAVRGYLLGATLLCLGLIFLGGPLLDAFQAIPVVGANSIGRLRSVLGFLVAVQAGVGLEAVLVGARDRRRITVVAAVLAAVSLSTAVLLAAVAETAAAVGRGDYLTEQLALPAVAFVLATFAVLVGLVSVRTRVREAVAGLVAVVVVAESVVFATGFLPRIDRELFYPSTPVHDVVAEELGHDRIAVDGLTMFPGSTVVYDLRSVTAHSLTPEPYADLLRAVDPEVFRFNRTYPVFTAQPALPSSPVLDRMGARLFVAGADTAVPGRAEIVTRAAGAQRVPAGAELTIDAPAGEVRAVRLDLREPIGPEVVTHVEVELVDATGAVVAAGRRRVHPRTTAGSFDVAVLPRDGGAGEEPRQVRVRVAAESGELTLGVAEPGRPAVTLVRPADDGLRVIFADGATVYERERSLPRIRWAGRSTVEPDAAARVDLLASGELPADTVVLDAPPTAPGMGDPAEVTVTEDSGDVVAATVDAAGPGFLVVADTLQDGWVATVDGAPAPLVDADHAFVAVPVGAGTHEVVLRYAPPGWATGWAVTGLALLGLVALIVWGRRGSRQADDDAVLRSHDATVAVE